MRISDYNFFYPDWITKKEINDIPLIETLYKPFFSFKNDYFEEKIAGIFKKGIKEVVIPKSDQETFSKELDGTEIIEVRMREVAFTMDTDSMPIVATFGCDSCVALGGYEETNHIAFVVHFSNATQVENSGELIFDQLAKLMKKKIEKPIQLHLRGGIPVEHSKQIIAAIESWMKQREDFPMEIGSSDILNRNSVLGESLLIDSRNGQVASYNPYMNPYPLISRKPNLLEKINALKDVIRVIHSPKDLSF